MIKTTLIKNRILKYKVEDTSTEAYIYYTLDLDRYELSISGEITGSYKWVETKQTESFVDLMKRCQDGYLLNKLFEKIFFNKEESIKSTLENIKYAEDEDVFNQIKNVDVQTDEAFYNEVEKILRDNYIDVEYETIDLVYEYPYWAVQAIDLFVKYVAPILEDVKD